MNPGWFGRLRQFLQKEPQNREELISLLRDAEDRALIDSDTLRMIEGVIQFTQLKVRDIMVTKNKMHTIPYDKTYNEVLDMVRQTGHSRFPVTGENNDEVIGILHAKDLFRYSPADDNQEFDLEDMVRLASFIPESKRLDLLLSEFRSNRNHMAIVVDEYGAVSGFVTIEDIIEQIVGDIEDEFDIDEEDYIKKHENYHYVLKGHTPIEEFNEQLHAHFSDEQYDTIGGIIMSHFGHLPERGEILTIEGWEFKILNADARRIKLLSCVDKRYLNKKEKTRE
ncbi:MAG: CBS domain-containing protein [Legionellaceae bacterium]|nr:CBS domain-containing protein [Legionellaceae bacterium]